MEEVRQRLKNYFRFFDLKILSSVANRFCAYKMLDAINRSARSIVLHKIPRMDPSFAATSITLLDRSILRTIQIITMLN